ncbi:MAG: hypothetical protein ACOYXT_25170 [Bacteroidota bacterium]
MRHAIMIWLTFLCLSVVAQTKKVIFVCEHGAAKSVIAATYFNKLAEERGLLSYEGLCRGTFPDPVLTQGTIDGLKRDNLLDPKLTPQKLVINDTTNVERIIFFTEIPADFKTNIRYEDWSSLTNLDADYSKRRDAIIKKLNELLDSLEKHK